MELESPVEICCATGFMRDAAPADVTKVSPCSCEIVLVTVYLLKGARLTWCILKATSNS